MAQNKFEQHIKEELNRREIQPSDNAWNKISNKLEPPQKEKKPRYMWLGVAASFAGLLIISTIYFNYDKTDSNDSNTVVETNKENIEIIERDSNSLAKEVEENQIANTEVVTPSNSKEGYKKEKVERLEKEIKKPIINEDNAMAIVQTQQKVKNDKVVFSQEEIIQQKIAEVVAKVDKLEKDSSTLTDLEVDALILQAQKEILQNKIFRQDRSVDAMALLNEVEGELERPLKDKLFDLLKKGILETKNALADSN
ncbi:hypothetical protein JBL43_08295 [Aureibaculum sp. A20]|uniref:Anti-sigma factor n=1 Tax=Aureibaculum flavum TaxID=2795986 RepID=A0ABS0WQI4_9FLAO|nr:hypothetical protein [Aureibaculum flavum]MBJ2174234.1 hypothetical protein [Aureibaculum flavum]